MCYLLMIQKKVKILAKKILTEAQKLERLVKVLKSQSDYWQPRLQRYIFDKVNKELNKRLKTVYLKANKSIGIELTALYEKMLSKGEISANMLYQENRYRGLQQKIGKIVQDIGKTEEKLVAKSLLTSYKQVYQQTMKGLGVDTSWTIINENMAKQIVNANFKGANFSERIWNNKSKLREQIEKSVIDSVIGGQSKDRAVKDIKNKFGVGFNDADRIVRTETQRVLNDGQRQTYKDRGYSQVEWLVADDERLCDECMGMLDGNPYNIDEVPSVLHPNCRCTFIPILDEDLFK